MKTIIVPIDFSNECLTGLDLALMLAGKSGAGIQMVHVVTGTKDIPHGVLETKHQEAKINFEKILQEYKDKVNKHTTLSYIVKEGKVYKEVDNQAGSFEDSVIVLSTHGRSGFEELFIGSNAYKIVSTSSKPVISVRNCRNIINIQENCNAPGYNFSNQRKSSIYSKNCKNVQFRNSYSNSGFHKVKKYSRKNLIVIQNR